MSFLDIPPVYEGEITLGAVKEITALKMLATEHPLPVGTQAR